MKNQKIKKVKRTGVQEVESGISKRARLKVKFGVMSFDVAL